MTTPICDFLTAYREKNATRLHMPGHKGQGPLGVEAYDLTEVAGADVLYRAQGIIRESEENAARLFGTAKTLYSTEGSSLCIRAMLKLVHAYATARGTRPHLVAARGAHSTLVSALGLLDIAVTWLSPACRTPLSCPITEELLASCLDAMEEPPTAVYVTSPDYTGNLLPIDALARICHARGVLLLVDNAHGAYLRFLARDRHPISLGADMTCDSAHKTLPCLTGTAYLHLSRAAPPEFLDLAEDAMALFASTSPSYLLLASLDGVNPRLEEELPRALRAFERSMAEARRRLSDRGIPLLGEEPLKLTVDAAALGYTGTELAARLEEAGFVPEMADPTLVVLIFSPWQQAALTQVVDLLLDLPRRAAPAPMPPAACAPPPVMSVREALLSPKERLPLDECVGRVLAQPTLTCPPAVPPIVSGERVTEALLPLLSFYGYTHLWVVK